MASTCDVVSVAECDDDDRRSRRQEDCQQLLPSAKVRLREATRDTTLLCGMTDLLPGLLFLSVVGITLCAVAKFYINSLDDWWWAGQVQVPSRCGSGAAAASRCNHHHGLHTAHWTHEVTRVGSGSVAAWALTARIVSFVALSFHLASALLWSLLLLSPDTMLVEFCGRWCRAICVRAYALLSLLLGAALLMSVVGFGVTANGAFRAAVRWRGDSAVVLAPLWCAVLYSLDAAVLIGMAINLLWVGHAADHALAATGRDKADSMASADTATSTLATSTSALPPSEAPPWAWEVELQPVSGRGILLARGTQTDAWFV
ncbi:hypothetical protein JKP88DRAFT_247005 [Tribonema minus]|uniref:Uncharacterized protein n=1 Tax=Tribonema minus TaxID=303371 RepID=A0A836CC44_9STRA|nr:hypothetical protein JKP88DRAFT_247005 [Tribonema minus]